jgi:hypothetical protein
MLTSTLSEQTTWHSPDGNQNTSATIWELANSVNDVSYGKPASVLDHYHRVSTGHR